MDSFPHYDKTDEFAEEAQIIGIPYEKIEETYVLAAKRANEGPAVTFNTIAQMNLVLLVRNAQLARVRKRLKLVANIGLVLGISLIITNYLLVMRFINGAN